MQSLTVPPLGTAGRRPSVSSEFTLAESDITGSESEETVNGSEEDITERRAIEEEVRKSYGTILKDEKVSLQPEPTRDSLDPLNWSSIRKHTILAIVMWM
jgi:hypothetical protein